MPSNLGAGRLLVRLAETPAGTLATVRLAGALTVFAVLVATLPLTHRWDERVTLWLQQAAPTLDPPAAVVVLLGNADIDIPAVVLVAGLLSFRNRRSGAAVLWLAAGLTIASLVVLALQHLIVQPGPAASLQRDAFERGLHTGRMHRAVLWGHRILMGLSATPYSFPSGHAVRTTFLAGMALRTVPWAAGMVMLGMMAALVYVGGHWLSDVLGGLFLGWAFLEIGVSVGLGRIIWGASKQCHTVANGHP